MRSPRTALLVSALLSPLAAAQAPDDPQMRQMMEHAQAMQACMARIDRGAMEELDANGRQMEADVRQLCAAGKRDEAQLRARRMGEEMAASPAMKELAKCGEMAKGMMPPMAAGADGGADGGGSVHVCDRF